MDPKPLTESEDADCPNQAGCLSAGFGYQVTQMCVLYMTGSTQLCDSGNHELTQWAASMSSTTVQICVLN